MIRVKNPGGVEKHRERKLRSLELEAAQCLKLTDLCGAGSPAAAAGAPGDERGGLDMMSEWRQTW